MALIKISQLPSAPSIDGSELSEIVQGGVNKKVLKSVERTYYQSNLGTAAFADTTDFFAATSTTTDLPEGTNLYFTEARVRSTPLTGLSITGSTISSTDTVLQAFGKMQNQINAVVGGVNYQGTWNANTNSPALVSSVGTKGYYYVVSTAGATNLNGITDWKLGDWAIFNGTAWEKVDNTDAVISVNGYVGAVSLVTTDIAEGTNLYYTNARGIGSTLTGYVSGAGTITSADTILSAIQKLNGNDALAWKVTGTTTLTGVATITSNANSQHIFNGTWTAGANSQYHISFQPSITGRASQPSGETVGAMIINPSLTAGTGSNTANLVGLLIQPTWNDNGASGVIHSYIRAFDGTTIRFQVTDTNATFASSSNTLTITNGVAGPQLSGSTGTLQLNSTSATGNVVLQLASNAWFGIQGSNMVGVSVFSVSTTVTSTATQQSSRNFNWQVNEWTGSAARINYWTSRATQSTTTNLLSYWDLFYGTTGSAPSLTNLYLRISNTDGSILIGATTNTTFTPNVTLDVIGGTAIRMTTKAQITANQNDYAIGSQSIFRMSSDASRNVTGLTGGFDGKLLEIYNVGSFNIVFTHEDSNSTAANRLFSSTGGNITLLPNGSLKLRYDSTTQRWRDNSVR